MIHDLIHLVIYKQNQMGAIDQWDLKIKDEMSNGLEYRKSIFKNYTSVKHASVALDIGILPRVRVALGSSQGGPNHVQLMVHIRILKNPK